MKDTLKNAFKETPSRFRYAVRSAVDEAQQSAPEKKRLSRPIRILLASALILALVPAAVFGAAKIISLIAQPVGNYGVSISVESQDTADYPEYVKMHVNVPDGFIVEPNTDDLKYSQVNTDGSFGEGAFSLCPMRAKDGADAEVIGNVDSYEEITLCGHTAYHVKPVGDGFDRVYVRFEDANVVLLIYYHHVTEAQLRDFVGGISFTESTAGDHTELWELFDERHEDKVAYEFGYTNIEYPCDTVMTFSGWSEKNNDESLRYTAQITGVHITDELRGLDSSLINDMYEEEGLTDNNGKLLPRTVTVTREGNGFDTVDEIISTEEKEQKLVLIDLTYTNLNDEDTVVYIPYSLVTFEKESDGSYDFSWNIDPENKITSSEYCDSEKLYVSDPVDTVHSFYCTALKANETKTVTIGFRCCTDMLDKAYLAIYDATSESIVDPAPDGYDGRDNIPNYIMKVQ